MGLRVATGRSALAILLVSALLAAACAGDHGVAPELAPLVGTWNARSAVFTNRQNPQQSIDIVRELRATLTMDIRADARATLTLVAFGQATTQTGQVRIEAGQLVLRADDPSRPDERWSLQLQANTMTLDGESLWDFNQDGSAEPASLHLVMVRS
ncbi:MAG: hypothetical protein HY704_03345 [Gemmatimonadetes bacterium]|nr:hypothetical protein [Gemmatimonadota bacterium]